MVTFSYLEQVGGEHVVSVAVIEGQGSGEAGHGNAVLDAGADRPAPRLLKPDTQPIKNLCFRVSSDHVINKLNGYFSVGR